MQTDFTAKWDEAGADSRDSHLTRIEPDHKLDVQLGFTTDGRRVMVVVYPETGNGPSAVPEFENIDLEFEQSNGSTKLSIILCESSLKDLFSSVCSDLVYSSIDAVDGAAAAHRLINRLIRWSDLLKEGASGGMSFSARLGLMGELTLLDTILDRDLVSKGSLITGWRGPDGDARDVALDSGSIEVKARMDSAKNTLKISSLDQLDIDSRNLALAYYRFSSGDTGTSLEDIVHKILNALADSPGTLRNFNRKLYLTGYDPDADYTTDPFSLTSVTYFRVLDEFPRLVRGKVSDAIVSANYEIDVTGLAEFELSEFDFEVYVSGRN